MEQALICLDLKKPEEVYKKREKLGNKKLKDPDPIYDEY